MNYNITKIEDVVLEYDVNVCFEMANVLIKELETENYMEQHQIFQEGLKEAWESDTDPIKGREDENAFMRVVKFLPRLIRNLIKWIGAQLGKLFGKNKSGDKARQETKLPPEAKETFEEDLKKATPVDPFEEAKKKLNDEADKTLSDIARQQYSDEVERVNKNIRTLSNKRDELLGNIKYMMTSNKKLTPAVLFDEIFQNGKTISFSNLDIIFGALTELDQYVNDIIKVGNEMSEMILSIDKNLHFSKEMNVILRKLAKMNITLKQSKNFYVLTLYPINDYNYKRKIVNNRIDNLQKNMNAIAGALSGEKKNYTQGHENTKAFETLNDRSRTYKKYPNVLSSNNKLAQYMTNSLKTIKEIIGQIFIIMGENEKQAVQLKDYCTLYRNVDSNLKTQTVNKSRMDNLSDTPVTVGGEDDD